MDETPSVRTRNNVIQSAQRKLQQGLITEAEFNVITDCDLLASFDEEGLLQSPGVLITPADEARQKLASGLITLQEARSIIDTHLADMCSAEEKTHITHVVEQWRKEHTTQIPTPWYSWIWKTNDEDEVEDEDHQNSFRKNSHGGGSPITTRNSMFLSKRNSSESMELSQSMLDPRVEICIVMYSDAICAYNDIQAEAEKSRREDLLKKKKIENKLEESRNARKKYLQSRSLSEEDQNERFWYPGKIFKKHFSNYSSSSKMSSFPIDQNNDDQNDTQNDTQNNAQHRQDKIKEQQECIESEGIPRSTSLPSELSENSAAETNSLSAASVWRSAARELLAFEEECLARAAMYQEKVTLLKSAVDRSFEELETLSLELHQKKQNEKEDDEDQIVKVKDVIQIGEEVVQNNKVETSTEEPLDSPLMSLSRELDAEARRNSGYEVREDC